VRVRLKAGWEITWIDAFCVEAVSLFGAAEHRTFTRTFSMTINYLLALPLFAIATTMFTAEVFAARIKFTQHFPGGFNVSINGGQLVSSGPITVTGILDDTSADIDPSVFRGEFPLNSVTFTGMGYLDREVITPLSLLIVSTHRELFAFQLVGKFNEGIIGWDDSTPPGTITANPNDLSYLTQLPFTTSGIGTFWHQALGKNAWELRGGDTIGAALGGGGPAGTFSINRVPEPSTYAAALSAMLFFVHNKNRPR
jgi:hypothetical protein